MWDSIKNYLKDFFNLFYPSICFACGNHLYDGEDSICIACRVSLPYTFDENESNNKCARVFKGRVKINGASSLFYFKKKSKVQNLLHYLKYKGSEGVGLVLGNIHAELLMKSSIFKEIDLIIPVPLHPNKFKMRGYNQAALLAKGYAEVMKVEYLENILVRVKNTSTQTHKSRFERYENMNNVFECKQIEQLRNKNILLIDDVITTGSTLEACAEVLIKYGCSGVWIASAAIA